MVIPKYKTTIVAPDIEGKYRHSFILETFDQLTSGEGLLLQNDHDPRPLYYQLMHERTNLFTWEYIMKGPDVWRVVIWKR